VIDHLGRPALTGTAFLKDVTLENGVIEVDIATADKSRSYPGVLFRVRDASNCERVYIRPHRSPLYDDALQYAPMFNGVDSWQLYHGPGRTAALDIPAGRWNHLKLLIAGDQARVFWNDGPEPALVIDQLARGDSAGTIGLVGPADGTAYFSSFSYGADDHLDLPPVAARAPVCGVIRDWALSTPFALLSADFTRYPDLSGLEWQSVTADEAGLVDISRYYPRKDRAGDCILARTILKADADTRLRLGCGYSDVLTVYLNGLPVFTGNSAYRSRDGSFLGIVGWFDDLFLPLRKGQNELLVQLGESSGGWGFCFRKEDDICRAPGISRAWSLKGPFSMPEAVIYDPSADVCYVSNYFHEGQEYLSKISPAGKVLDPMWVKGLSRPTGMCVREGTLYAADRSGLVVIDTEKGKIRNRIALPDALMPNDVAIDPEGNLYISDTAGNAVFRFAEGKPAKWLRGLDGPNGLCWEKGRLLIGQNEKLVAADLATGALSSIATFEPGSNIDGLQPDGRGGYLASDYHGRLYRVTPSGATICILDTSTPGASIADFGFIPILGLVVIPTLSDNSVVAYSLKKEAL
jgi:DNA-binding beta-propeller fold protein YncE